MKTIVALSSELTEDIRACQASAAKLLSLTNTESPKDIVTKLTEWVRHQKDSGSMPKDDVLINLGTLLGEQYVRAFAWHWGEVAEESNPDGTVCVLSQDDSIAINPIWWVNVTFKERSETNFLLNFNMVAAGQRPSSAKPGAAIWMH